MNATQTIVEQVQNAFDFTVDKFPLSGPDGMRTNLYGLFTSNGSQVGNSSVKSRYVPHTTDDVLALVDAASTAFDDDIKVECHFRDGHFVTVKPSEDYRKQIIGSDTVWPKLLINASYDGRAFSASMGIYRDACDNMMMIRKIKETTVSIRHTRGLREKMDELVQTFGTLKHSWQNLESMIDHMNETPVDSVSDILIQIYGLPDEDSKKSKTMHIDRIQAILNRMQREYYRTGQGSMPAKPSKWMMYNAIQGYHQHDAIRRGKTTDFDMMLSSNAKPEVIKAQELLCV